MRIIFDESWRSPHPLLGYVDAPRNPTQDLKPNDLMRRLRHRITAVFRETAGTCERGPQAADNKEGV